MRFSTQKLCWHRDRPKDQQDGQRTDYERDVMLRVTSFRNCANPDCSATTEAEHRRALERAIIHLQDADRRFRQDRDDFALIMPPARFQEFHLLMNSALHDFVQATNAFITYYSKNLNQETQDLELANRASTLLRTANENLQRAGYMHAELLQQR